MCTVLIKHYKKVLLVCVSFIAGLLVMQLFFPKPPEEFPYQNQAYAEKGFIQFYDSSLRNWLFKKVDKDENEEFLDYLTEELERVLSGMRARVMYELVVSGKEYEDYNPYFEDSKAHDPDQYEIYMHTQFFNRLARWQNKWGARSETEQEKINNIRLQWNQFDNKAQELGLTNFSWGGRWSENSLENIYKFTYIPHEDRYNQIESLISHFEGLNEGLERVAPVFIDFARDSDLKHLKIIEKTHESENIKAPYSALYFKGKYVELKHHQEKTVRLISLLRKTPYKTITKPNFLVEEDFVLRGKHFQMHFLNNNIVYVIWVSDNTALNLAYDRGYFKVDDEIMNEIVELLRNLYSIVS